MPEKGERLSDETKAKMSAAHKGEKNPNYGKPRSEETKAKISAAQKGEKNHNYGKSHSEETKAKMRAANTGKLRSEETKQRISAAITGKLHSEETKAKLREANMGAKNPHYGKPRSEETKTKMRAAHARRREAAAAAAALAGGLGGGEVSVQGAVSVASLADPVRLAQGAAFPGPRPVPGSITLPSVRSISGVGEHLPSATPPVPPGLGAGEQGALAGPGAGEVSVQGAVSVASLADPVRLAQQAAFPGPRPVPGSITLPSVRSISGVGEHLPSATPPVPATPYVSAARQGEHRWGTAAGPVSPAAPASPGKRR